MRLDGIWTDDHSAHLTSCFVSDMNSRPSLYLKIRLNGFDTRDLLAVDLFGSVFYRQTAHFGP
jgi:hypothetical protein